jgi:hypothetical protein
MPKPAGTSCSDNDVCNGAELCDGAGQCAGGTPLDCDDKDACTRDRCDAASGCAHDPIAACCACHFPTYPGLLATFQVGSESYAQEITSPSGIDDAIALWQGKSTKHIPNGALRCGCSGWNCAWNFYVEPSTVEFSTGAIELCDGTPSYVDANCGTFGGGTYCPWSAILVELRDCRVSVTCPLVPR